MIVTSKQDAWSEAISNSVQSSCLLESMEIVVTMEIRQLIVHQFVRQFTLTTLLIYSSM